MLFDSAEIQALRLCAWCKNLPVGSCRNIPADILNTLAQLRLMRLSRNQLAYRCTPEGFTVLQAAQLPCQPDKDYRSSGDKLQRRLQTAEITSFFWRYGADVFAEAPPAETQENIFLPAFVLRRQQHANILGGAKLTGFYYTKDSVFIPYFIEAGNNGIFPEVEQRTFRANMFLQGRKPHVLYTGNEDLGTLIDIVSYKKERSAKATTAYYRDAMEQFNCPVAIVPMNTDGMRQLRILSVPDYRQGLMRNILGKNYLPPASPYADGKTQTEDFIIGIDCNISRFEQAMQSSRPTNIFVLPFQAEAVQDLVAGSHVNCYVLNMEQTEQFLGVSHALPAIDRTPFQTEKGGYVDVPYLGEIKKAGR